jgi:hypothetical protein
MKVCIKEYDEENKRKNKYKIKTDVFKQECKTGVVWDCITQNLKAFNIHYYIWI